jgi:hypothetical protein
VEICCCSLTMPKIKLFFGRKCGVDGLGFAQLGDVRLVPELMFVRLVQYFAQCNFVIFHPCLEVPHHSTSSTKQCRVTTPPRMRIIISSTCQPRHQSPDQMSITRKESRVRCRAQRPTLNTKATRRLHGTRGCPLGTSEQIRASADTAVNCLRNTHIDPCGMIPAIQS